MKEFTTAPVSPSVGSWAVRETEAIASVFAANGEEVCEVWLVNKDGQAEANARLIAAAPELGQALRKALSEWEFKRETEGGRNGEVTPGWIYDARASLAKAGL
jgi:hypothetical protein